VLCTGDLPWSLTLLKSEVARLLANPLDARHIVPGLVPNKEAVAYWSEIDSETLIPGYEVPCLHDLAHPDTGPAAGATEKRIQLGDEQDDCLIRIKEALWISGGSDGSECVTGMRARLILKGPTLATKFRSFARTAPIDDFTRLVAFPESSLAHVHQAMMAQMEGIYLPVPPAWRRRTKKHVVTHARTMALVSRLTSMPIEELQAIDQHVRAPSKSTLKRLKNDIQLELSRLVPVPAATLFRPSDDPFPTHPASGPTGDIDPLIAEAYSAT
jgi:hypothetical protein